MPLSKETKVELAKIEVRRIEELIYQQVIRGRVAVKIKDEAMKEQSMSTLERLEKQLQAFREELVGIEQEKEEEL